MHVRFPGEKRYGGVWFNVISITMGWVGVEFRGENRYETLEWPIIIIMLVGYIPTLATNWPIDSLPNNRRDTWSVRNQSVLRLIRLHWIVHTTICSE